jgi:NSS family neurotransmitter:Na+ symporter
MATAPTTAKRGQWGSQLGFILAAAGSAVGLGNIWRFPYLTGENGGGAFVLVYLACVLLIGLPLLFNEIALGRLTGKNPLGAIRDKIPDSHYKLAGLLCILVCFFVLSYYSVIAGWTIGYVITTATATDIVFNDFIATPGYVIPLLGLFIVLTVLVVTGGVSGGIEKAAKILMPMLLLILVALIIRSVTLEGAGAGIEFYLTPDFSKINGNTLLAALGQAFFSMSVGWGLMVTYGSYLPKDQNIISAGGWVAFADTFVALLGGLLIFPAVFAFGKDPASGPTLVFQVLPEIFGQMPGGHLVGALFFVLLMIAALTSTISMLEVPVSWLLDERKWNRKTAAWTIGGAAFLFGIPSALSQGAVGWLSDGGLFGMSFLDFMDKYWGTMGVTIISLMFSVFVGWRMKTSDSVDEIAQSASIFKRKMLGLFSPAQLWVFFIRFICPITIVIMLWNSVSE